MRVDTLHIGDAAVVRLEGDADMATSPELRQAVLDVLRERAAGTVVVNLSGVEYIDSSAVATLIECLRQAASGKVHFRLTGLNEGPRKVLSLTRLIDVFEIHPSEEEALRA